jgi:hypothetical protein
MFYNKRLKSDYVSLFNKKTEQTLPQGYPCTFDSDCTSPAVCQFNVCTINIGGNNTNDLANICKGLSIKECAKAMQKERETTNVPIYIPSFPTIPTPSSTGGNDSSNVTSITIQPKVCKYDKECNKNEVCITGVCVDKSNFPLIARQKRLKQLQSSNIYNNSNELNRQNIYTIAKTSNNLDIKKYFEHKNTPLDGRLSPYEYMFLLENNKELDRLNNANILKNIHDDYFYMND